MYENVFDKKKYANNLITEKCYSQTPNAKYDNGPTHTTIHSISF